MHTKRPSIRLLVGAVVIVPLLLVCAALVSLSSLTNRHIAHDLGDSYVQSAAASVQNQIGRYLQDAVRVSDQYVRRIERGALPVRDMKTAWEPTMLDDLATTAAVASICFGNVDGQSTWLLRNKDHLEVGRGDGPGEGQAVEYVMREDGTTDALIRRYLYDPRLRPWWTVAVEANKPTWTPIYFWFGSTALDGTASSGHTRLIRSGNGELIGVLIIDVTLGDIGGFLSRLAQTTGSYFYIVDAKDQIVATSHGSALGTDGKLIPISQHASKPAQAAAAALIDGKESKSIRAESLHFGDEAAKMSVVRLNPYDGIDWRLVCVLPESQFLADANEALQRETLISLGAVLVGVLLALVFGRQVTRPLIRLTQHIRGVGRGDFDTRLELDAASELRILSNEINQMAAGLRDLMQMQKAMDVAREVQQSLLPAANPSVPGLDIDGRSQYCDETGGDYYDFVPLQRADGPTTLVTVGDVMGHGIAAALLMTSARAALRVHCIDETHLGRLLTRINDLLSHEAKHGAFMTMIVAAFNPTTRSVHWASAGHDLPMIYHPDKDDFAAITGSHVPLGVMEQVAYEEYAYRNLSPGTVIMLGTDGVWESMNEQGKLFGKERVKTLLRENSKRSAKEIADAIEAALKEYRGATKPKDDTTFVVVRVG